MLFSINLTPAVKMHNRAIKNRIIPTFLLCLLCVLSMASVYSHPIEYHMQPLDAETVERVIQSLDQMVADLKRSGTLGTVRLPDSAMGISVMLWSVQDALMKLDETTTIDSPTLKRALFAVGYQDSLYVVEEWQIEAEQVLETYEVLNKGLNLDQVYAGYAALEKDRPALSEVQANSRESTLVRKHELVRTTAKDLELVERYLPQLDSIAARLGIKNSH